MAFDSLINQPQTEEKILQAVAREIQADYGANQNTAFFLKLEKAEDGISKVAWIRPFTTFDECWDYYWDSEYCRACILVKFTGEDFGVLCNGFWRFDRFFVSPTDVFQRKSWERHAPDYEMRRRPPRDLVEGAFGELNASVASLRRPKAV